MRQRFVYLDTSGRECVLEEVGPAECRLRIGDRWIDLRVPVAQIFASALLAWVAEQDPNDDAACDD